MFVADVESQPDKRAWATLCDAIVPQSCPSLGSAKNGIEVYLVEKSAGKPLRPQ